jgi:hypothetical protein
MAPAGQGLGGAGLVRMLQTPDGIPSQCLGGTGCEAAPRPGHHHKSGMSARIAQLRTIITDGHGRRRREMEYPELQVFKSSWSQPFPCSDEIHFDGANPAESDDLLSAKSASTTKAQLGQIHSGMGRIEAIHHFQK